MKEKSYVSSYAKVIVLVLALIVLGISSTYAYYTSNISGEPSNSQLQAGKLELDTNLTEAEAITAENLNLINEGDVDTQAQKVEFHVKAKDTTNVGGKYNIYLKDVKITSNLRSDDFKWKLTKSGGTDSAIEGSFSSVKAKAAPTANEPTDESDAVEDIQLNSTPITLSATKDEWEFRIWLQNDPDKNQISLTEGSFSAKLYVEAVPVSSQAPQEE